MSSLFVCLFHTRYIFDIKNSLIHISLFIRIHIQNIQTMKLFTQNNKRVVFLSNLQQCLTFDIKEIVWNTISYFMDIHKIHIQQLFYQAPMYYKQHLTCLDWNRAWIYAIDQNSVNESLPIHLGEHLKS